MDPSVTTSLKPGFEYYAQLFTLLRFLFEFRCEDDENKQKEAGIDPYLKKIKGQKRKDPKIRKTTQENRSFKSDETSGK